jgi:hypothetical protein
MKFVPVKINAVHLSERGTDQPRVLFIACNAFCARFRGFLKQNVTQCPVNVPRVFRGITDATGAQIIPCVRVYVIVLHYVEHFKDVAEIKIAFVPFAVNRYAIRQPFKQFNQVSTAFAPL